MAGASAAASIIGTGVSVGSSLLDSSKSDAASAKAEAAQKSADASYFNAQRDMLDAVRLQNESDMESEFTTFTYDREAAWIEAWTPVEEAYQKISVNQSKLSAYQDADVSAKLAVDLALGQVGNIFKTALSEADIANMTAEAKAKYTEAKGRSESRQLEAERAYQLDQMRMEARQQEGEVVAKIASQGREMTGSALDVMQKYDDINGKKAAYLKLKAGSQISDVAFDAGYDAATTRRSGHLQAQEIINDAVNKGDSLISEAEIKNEGITQELNSNISFLDSKLEYSLLTMKTESERSVYLMKEEGWRSVWNLEQDTQDSIWSLQYDMMDQIYGGSSSASASSKYDEQSSSTDWGSLAKAGSSLMSGVPNVYSSGVKAQWWS